MKTTSRVRISLHLICLLLFFVPSSYGQMGWTQMASLPAAVREYVGAFAIGNYGYIGTGYNGSCLSDCYKWNSLTNTWTAIASYPGAGPWSPTSFAIEGKGYFGLGEDCSLVKHSDLWQYDPLSNTWTAMTPLPASGRYDAPCFVLGHKAWVVGGSFGGPPYTNEVWMYDAHQNTWTKKNPFPGGLWEGMLAFAIGNRGYAGCGWDGTNEHNTMYQYDTTTDTWTLIASFPGAGTGLGGTPHAYVIGSKAYACIGKTGAGYALPVAWIYDTVTKAWCPFSRLDTLARAYGAAFQVNNVGYIGVGTDTNGSWNTSRFRNDLWRFDPSSSIVVNDTNVCVNPSVAFSGITGIDTTEAVSWEWTFTGGTPTTSTSQYPTVTYTAGTYTVQLIVSNCAIADTVNRVIHVLGNNFPIIISGNTSICTGESDTLTASGGTSYLWSNGSTSTSIIVNPGSTTTYTVTVTNGPCKRDTTITVNTGAKLPVLITGTNPVCAGTPVTLSATGGKGYSYTWSNGATTSSITVTPATNTTYSVTVTNGSCTGDTSYAITILPLPVAKLSNDTAICAGNAAKLSASGGTSYVWTPGGNTNSTISVTPTSTTTYTVQISNGSCTIDTTITVNVTTPPTVSITPDQKICAGNNVTLQATGGGSYLWSNGATTSSITVSPASTTGYTVVVSNGCKDSASTSVSVVTLSLKACCDTVIAPGDSVNLSASGTSAYLWSPTSGFISCTTCPNVTVSPSVTTTYTVTSDSGGCVLTAEVTVDVEIPCADFTVPNIFTPNNDGINDDLVIRVLNPSSYSINIYDRWGKEMYTSTDATKYWNGTLLNTPYLVPDGVYYYIIKATCGNNTYNKKGFVQVIGEK